MRTIGIDFGTKNVGVAISDEHGKIAFPHGVVNNDSGLADTIVTLIRQKKVERIVIGESKNYMGKPNPIMAKARRFGDQLRERTGLALDYEPEAMTTIQALKDRMKPQKPTANPHRTASPIGNTHMDDAAATIILQHYLERKRNEAANLGSHERQIAH